MENIETSPTIGILPNSKPFLKLPGGKRKLLPILMQHFPQDFWLKSYYYVEPFVGGGSVYLHTKQEASTIKTSGPRAFYINDFNPDIANAWLAVKYRPEELIKRLIDLKEAHSKEQFLRIRNLFTVYPFKNESFLSSSLDYARLDRAANFIYLNKTAFNGLIRFNKSGQFNAPFGEYTNPGIFTPVNLLACSKTLENTQVTNLDFADVIKELTSASSPTFFYLDPPYLPISVSSKFAEYTANGFGILDHARLSACLKLIDSNGGKFLLSNSYSNLTREIYKGWEKKVIRNVRTIGASSASRGSIKEYLISNYNL